MRLPEAVVGGPRCCRGGGEEAFLKGRQVLNEELEHAVDLFGDTDPADGWPSVITLTRTREKKKNKKGRTVETGRIIAGFRIVECGSSGGDGTAVEGRAGGDDGRAGLGGHGGGGDEVMRWPGIGRLLGRGQVEVRVYVIEARGLASKDGMCTDA